ncbi:acyltransferase [Halochromatium roseum]|uniref:acyltransferase n=1 Tax=Halochromatium roseum TaxID=391920 RepID=UPI001911E774|nr:acyltransferase [Halochromatium roseum]
MPAIPLWSQALSRYPFATVLMAGWREAAAELPEVYSAALDAALAAFDPERPLTERYQQLCTSRARLVELAIAGDQHLATQLVRLRVWSAFGELRAARQLCVELLEQREQATPSEGERPPQQQPRELPQDLAATLRERPFLPSCARFDSCPPQAEQGLHVQPHDLNAWLNGMLIETDIQLNVERRHNQPQAELARLAQRHKLPNAEIESERMLALAALRLQKKVTIKPGSRLLVEGKNTEHWKRLGEKQTAMPSLEQQKLKSADQRSQQIPVANHEKKASAIHAGSQSKKPHAHLLDKARNSSAKENEGKLLSLLRTASKNEIQEFAKILMPFIADAELRQVRVWGDRSRLHLENITIPVNDLLINTRSGHVTIKENCFFGHRCMLLTGTHDYRKKGIERLKAVPSGGRDITLEKGVWLGSDVTVLGPVHIGENAVVAAGSLVTKDVAPNTIVAGRPASLVKTIQFDESAQHKPLVKKRKRESLDGRTGTSNNIDKLLVRVNGLHAKGKTLEAKKILHNTFKLKKSGFSVEHFFKKTGLVERINTKVGGSGEHKKVLVLGSKPDACIPKKWDLVFGANSSIKYYSNEISNYLYKIGVWGPIGIESLTQLAEGGADEIVTLGDKVGLFEGKSGQFRVAQKGEMEKNIFYSILSFSERREMIGDVVGLDTPFFHDIFFSIDYQYQYQLLKHCIDFKFCHERGINKAYDWPLPLRPSSGVFSLIVAIVLFNKNAEYRLAGIGSGLKDDTRYIHPTRLGDLSQKNQMEKIFGLDAHVTADLEIIELLSKKFIITTTDASLSEMAKIKLVN